MIQSDQLFQRAIDNEFSFALYWNIRDKCSAEVDAACEDCDIAYRKFKNSKGKSNKLRAEANYRRKQADYCERLAVYYEFLGADE